MCSSKKTGKHDKYIYSYNIDEITKFHTLLISNLYKNTINSRWGEKAGILKGVEINETIAPKNIYASNSKE